MSWYVPLKVAQSIVELFCKICEVKTFVDQLLEKYAKSTDNDVDDMMVNLVRAKLLKNCPE